MRVFLILIAAAGIAYAVIPKPEPVPSETVGQRAVRECRVEASADSRKDCVDRKIIGAAFKASLQK